MQHSRQFESNHPGVRDGRVGRHFGRLGEVWDCSERSGFGVKQDGHGAEAAGNTSDLQSLSRNRPSGVPFHLPRQADSLR
jgi:hypothetical protein